MNIYYNKIRFIKIWKWWEQLYNAFVKLYSTVTEEVFAVRIHKGKIHFSAMWNSIFKSKCEPISILHYCVFAITVHTDLKSSCQHIKYRTRAHHIFYLEKRGLQRMSTCDYTHPLQSMRDKTIDRNRLPQGRAAGKNLRLFCSERVDKGNQELNFSGII